MLVWLLAVVLVAVLVVVLAWVFQRRLIYLPDRSAVPSAATVLPGGRDVTFTTADGLRLHAWEFPPAGPSRGVAVLVAGGNGGNRAGRAPLARALTADGMSVLLMDYRGYGGNPGEPTEEGLALDAKAARDHLARPGRSLIYFGESLGAAVVTRLAAEHPPAGLVLRSPFTDLASAGRAAYPFLPVRTLLRDRFPLAATLRGVRAPTIVLYGTRDTIVPAALSRETAAASPALVAAVEISGAGHNDPVMFDGPQVVGAVTRLAGRI
ncbi:alpha/beta fold hydrolase [Spongiactinospora sp. TRM90649]|uniref:alpha/beta hydrolase n=1 Tax=Spongiactinospora sp. TRM90649 TaxID=3031114 RepID=UPI0023F6A2A4|nr:alpha/beta fold hydrolase [Spongiactinospora sp. TRM90649]MDF5755300.1 alpha/beta fold hydrolase [Spongiactinospora sp. TRM90649]